MIINIAKVCTWI